MMAQDMAENGLMTLTERSQNSKLKDEAARYKTDLLTQKGLFQGSILRFKKSIRNFHWSEENGLSIQKLSINKRIVQVHKDGHHSQRSSTKNNGRQGDPETRNC